MFLMYKLLGHVAGPIEILPSRRTNFIMQIWTDPTSKGLSFRD